MNCQKCGHELGEGAQFCINCGAAVGVQEQAAEPVQETAAPEVPVQEAVPVAPANQVVDKVKKSVKKADKMDLISLIIGTLIIIIGWSRLGNSSVSISSTSFGADFYTYCYRGIVACANMLGTINATLSWVLIAIGLVIDLKALRGIVKKND